MNEGKLTLAIAMTVILLVCRTRMLPGDVDSNVEDSQTLIVSSGGCLGLRCYFTFGEQQERIVPCKGSCYTVITAYYSLKRCSVYYHEDGCFVDSAVAYVYCNTDLCNNSRYKCLTA